MICDMSINRLKLVQVDLLINYELQLSKRVWFHNKRGHLSSRYLFILIKAYKPNITSFGMIIAIMKLKEEQVDL